MVDKKKKEKVGRIKYVVVKEKRRRRPRRGADTVGRKRTGKKKTAEEVKRLAEQPKYQGLSQGQVPVSSANLPPSWIRQSIAPPTTITPAQSGVFQPPGTKKVEPEESLMSMINRYMKVDDDEKKKGVSKSVPAPEPVPVPVPLPSPSISDSDVEGKKERRSQRRSLRAISYRLDPSASDTTNISIVRKNVPEYKNKTDTEIIQAVRNLPKFVKADFGSSIEVTEDESSQASEPESIMMNRFTQRTTQPQDSFDFTSMRQQVRQMMDQDAELANVDQAPMPRQLTPLEQQQIQRAIQSYEPFSLFKQ